jgi:hypothetical protein
MHPCPRRPALLFFCLLGSLPLAPSLRAADSAADVAERLRALESRLTAVEQENAALRRELGRPSTPALAVSSSTFLPPSASSSSPLTSSSATSVLRFAADIRTRFSSVQYQAPEAATRDQLLFQLHAGVVATLGEDIEGGVRLSAGDLNSTFGGSPLSAQFSASDNSSRKTALLDQLYLRWKTTLAAGTTAALTLGKAANPFYTPSRLLFDNDYQPEGATEEFSFTPTAAHRLTLAAGQYVLDELSASARDPLLLAARARWEAQWQPTWSTTFGLAQLAITHPITLTAANLANNHRGNTRTPTGLLRYAYRPVFAEASVTHLIAHAPGYAGKFPVTLGAEFLHNPGAPAQRDAWTAALTFGRSGKAGQWEFGYRYVRVEADAWFEEMLEGDYAGYYRTVPPGWNSDPTSLAGGPANGSNTRSHVFRSSYSPRDYLLFSANLFLNDLAHRIPGNTSDTAAKRLQVETLLRF